MLIFKKRPMAGLLAGFLLCLASFAPLRAEERPVVGLIENVQLLGLDMTFVAKIDTGAKTSAINAFDVRIFKSGKKSRVRFKIQSRSGETVELELPVVRFAKVRRAGAETDVRPVVNLPICIGNQAQEAQFTLKYRKGMNYCMLIEIGRAS
ncbi:MAG: RimK/LysX family protein, partial [Rhodospirillales bacterium]